MKCKEFKAWIEMDGGPVPEYAFMQIGSSVECYIESVPGKNFVVHWSCEEDLFSSGYIVIDGRACPGRFLKTKGATNRAGVRTGTDTERPFTFMSTNTTGHVIGEDQFPLGAIQLKIMLSEQGKRRRNTNQPKAPAWLDAPLPPPTASGHKAGYGLDRECSERYALTYEGKPVGAALGIKPHSYVKFIFKYRPMEWLMQYNIQDILVVGGSESITEDEEVTGDVPIEEYQDAVSKFIRFILETEGPEKAKRLFPTSFGKAANASQGDPQMSIPSARATSTSLPQPNYVDQSALLMIPPMPQQGLEQPQYLSMQQYHGQQYPSAMQMQQYSEAQHPSLVQQYQGGQYSSIMQPQPLSMPLSVMPYSPLGMSQLQYAPQIQPAGNASSQAPQLLPVQPSSSRGSGNAPAPVRQPSNHEPDGHASSRASQLLPDQPSSSRSSSKAPAPAPVRQPSNPEPDGHALSRALPNKSSTSRNSGKAPAPARRPSTPETMDVDVEYISSDTEREPTPPPKPKRRKNRTKEEIAADKAEKERKQAEYWERLQKREDEVWAEREKQGQKRPPPFDWEKCEQNLLKGRTWEEVTGPMKCYKGYKFTKGSKPSLQLKADMAKKAAEAEAAKKKEKGKEAEKEKDKEAETSNKKKKQPQRQLSQSDLQYHAVPELQPVAGPSSSSSASSASASSSVQRSQPQQVQSNPRSSNTYVLPRTAVQIDPARLAASGVPVGGSQPQQIHGFMNLYAPKSQPQAQRPSAVIDTRIPPHMLMTQEQFERMCRSG